MMDAHRDGVERRDRVEVRIGDRLESVRRQVEVGYGGWKLRR